MQLVELEAEDCGERKNQWVTSKREAPDSLLP